MAVMLPPRPAAPAAPFTAGVVETLNGARDTGPGCAGGDVDQGRGEPGRDEGTRGAGATNRIRARTANAGPLHARRRPGGDHDGVHGELEIGRVPLGEAMGSKDGRGRAYGRRATFGAMERVAPSIARADDGSHPRPAPPRPRRRDARVRRDGPPHPAHFGRPHCRAAGGGAGRMPRAARGVSFHDRASRLATGAAADADPGPRGRSRTLRPPHPRPARLDPGSRPRRAAPPHGPWIGSRSLAARLPIPRPPAPSRPAGRDPTAAVIAVLSRAAVGRSDPECRA